MIRHQDIGMDCAIVMRDENRKQIQEPKAIRNAGETETGAGGALNYVLRNGADGHLSHPVSVWKPIRRLGESGGGCTRGNNFRYMSRSAASC